MSREINLWKTFDLLRGSNLWPLAPSAWCLTARPPELKLVKSVNLIYLVRCCQMLLLYCQHTQFLICQNILWNIYVSDKQSEHTEDQQQVWLMDLIRRLAGFFTSKWSELYTMLLKLTDLNIHKTSISSTELSLYITLHYLVIKSILDDYTIEPVLAFDWLFFRW